MERIAGFKSSSEGKSNEREGGNNENFDLASGDEHQLHLDGSSSTSRRLHYNRHTPHQIQQLEKLKRERHENAILKQENEQLRLENLAMKEAVKKPVCNECGGQATIPDISIQQHKLLIENARLKEELSNMTSVVNQLSITINNNNKNPTDLNHPTSQMVQLRTNNYGYLHEHASTAIEELLKLGLLNAPLWNKNMEGGGETLNFEEYARAFPHCRLGIKPLGFVSESTRASGVLPMTSLALVEALLNAQRWREMFVGMIGSCDTMEVISNGIGGGSRNGALQVMKAEIQFISPLVPVRVVKFIRHAKQQANGIWIVVDVSVNDGMEGNLTRKCPSGCILHDMPNGFSKVTWIEHTEYDEKLAPQQYRQLVRSGLGFGAQRWISALLRHCEALRATTSPTLTGHLSINTKISLKGLAKRMTSIFCDAVCLTGDQQWDLVADAPGRPRIMARKCMSSLGEPAGGIITSASYSVWIPANHGHLFDLLLTKELRCMGWDVICHEIASKNMIHFPLGQDEISPNCISILSSNETASDMTGSLIVYATVDLPAVSMVMNGEDTSSVALLPLGLCIVPGYGECGTSVGECGSMVTLGFHILLRDLATSNLAIDTINTINDLVSRTVLGIKEIGRSS
ncbi:hypothetical protein E3N88_46314 [Mikania micrantha]|uniref:START domain-containing protein n=1 Tax=Mikania micrantha TaxID=192012 RepID=A0A5N6L914_9ASTR|nr:hypothetical protein E3N88_46314 [Mikania micrantha]